MSKSRPSESEYRLYIDFGLIGLKQPKIEFLI